MTSKPWPYISIGNPGGEILLFLHGFMGSGRDWLPIARHFESDYLCVMPDLPGHGKNLDLPLDEPLGYPSLAAGLLQLMSEFDAPQVSLVGYSMGGRLGTYFAIHHPGKVAALILESAHPGIVDQGARRDRAQLDQQRASAIQRDGLSAFVDSWYQMDLFRSMAQHSEAFAAMKTARSRNSAEWMAKVIHEMSPGVQPSLWDGLPNLISDVLLIAGAQDSKYTSTLKIAAGKMPRASLAVIPNAGHNTHFEAPDPFANTVKNFLEAATLKRK